MKINDKDILHSLKCSIWVGLLLTGVFKTQRVEYGAYSLPSAVLWTSHRLCLTPTCYWVDRSRFLVSMTFVSIDWIYRQQWSFSKTSARHMIMRPRPETRSRTSNPFILSSARHHCATVTHLIEVRIPDFEYLKQTANLDRGGYTYASVFNLPARGRPHSVFGSFVHADTI